MFLLHALSFLMSNIPKEVFCSFSRVKLLNLSLACFLPCCAVNKTNRICLQNTEFCLDLRPPMDFHLRTSTWLGPNLGISLGFTAGGKKRDQKQTWENIARFFSTPKRFCRSPWMKSDKVDCNFCFCQKLFGFSSQKSLESRVSVGPEDRRLTPRFAQTH